MLRSSNRVSEDALTYIKKKVIKIMAKTKKRPSKKAKAAKKVLEKSELLKNSKTTNSLRSNNDDSPSNSVVTNNVAFKPRPNKKRG